ncbi:hypothetical protein PHYPSEUDO_007470 [Phytophthora pseudosyringae]|uniref:Uncharacterized protein n=1 Tax=Phytophthora pseudosyringae TaxID=221518 RepID=A0A8T1WNS5_9STRA|nr:hypothetical protein PHYPSEUDO_007470 [Phytophthora pseudosyringae]
MDGTSSVQTLIDQFELMAQANAAPRTWSATRYTKSALSKPGNSPLRTRTQSEPVQMTQKTEEPDAEPAEEVQETPVAKPTTTPTKLAVYKSLTVDTAQYDDDNDATYTPKCTCYSTVPRSPSTYSTTSTGSLDSLLSSLDIFLPELLQATGEPSAEIVKPANHRSRRSSLPENLQSTNTSKLIPPPSYRRASLTPKQSSTATAKASTKPRRSSLYAPKNALAVAPTPARPRRSSLSATMVPSTVKQSARGAPRLVPSPRARRRSNSSSVSRYMDYDSSPRFAATKAMNLERRRQLEERNRSLAAAKSARRPCTPEWQSRLDRVRSRLFDANDDNHSQDNGNATTLNLGSPRV